MEDPKKTGLNGISETMLQTLYARAKESEKPKHKIYEAIYHRLFRLIFN